MKGLITSRVGLPKYSYPWNMCGWKNRIVLLEKGQTGANKVQGVPMVNAPLLYKESKDRGVVRNY